MVQGIDPVYSLLDKQKQDRAAEVARRERKNERNDLLAGLLVKGGMAIGNQILQNKTYDFMNSTEQRGATQLAAQADANIVKLQQEIDEIESSGTGAVPYLTEKMMPFMRKALEAKTPDWMEGLDVAKFEERVYDAAKKVAEERWKILQEARSIYEDEGMNEFSKSLEATRKRYRATDLGDLATKSVSKIFNGKSKQDLEVEEILAYRDFIDDQDENSRAYHAKKLNALVDAYEKTGDLAIAQVSAANKMIRDEEIDPKLKFQVEPTVEVTTGAGGRVIITRQDKTTDYSIQNPDGTYRVTMGEAEVTFSDKATKADLLAATRSAFDIQKYVEQHFTKQGKEIFFDALDTRGVSLANLGDPETYMEYASVFSELAPAYTRDEVAEAIFAETGKELFGAQAFAKFKSLMAKPTETPEEKAEFAREFDIFWNNYYSQVEKGQRVFGILKPDSVLNRGQN